MNRMREISFWIIRKGLDMLVRLDVANVAQIDRPEMMDDWCLVLVVG